VDKKGVSTWVIVAIIVIAVVIGGIAVYVLYSGGGEEEGPTPTPAPTPDVAGATSIGIKVNATWEGGVNELYAFTAKNLGTSDTLLRVDMTDAQGNVFIYLYNQTAQTLWIQYDGAWVDSSTDFASYWDGENSAIVGYTALDGYKTELATNWSGSGDHDYTSDEDTFHIYDIILNPSVEDSLFVHG
jgi:hypothetical protein